MIKSNSGFTLVELLVTISILAILSAIGLVVFRNAVSLAKDNQKIKDLQAIKQALELYRGDVHNYPTTAEFSLKTSSSLNKSGFVYLQPIPKDSDTLKNYYYLALSNSPACDNASSATACLSFILCAKKESSTINASYNVAECNNLVCGGTTVQCDIGVSSD